MTIFKCKMCGGTLEFNPGDTVAVCDSCGTKQTLPKLDDDRRANLYDRANHFRRSNEYDKAMGIYEQILAEDNTDAEAYWSLVLCRYGIEYVEDPATHKRVPTVNRAQFTSIFDDDNYKSALHYADAAQREVYESEAKAINEIQKGILAISQKEQPFDVFICYKETDASGRRTPDSVLANDLYHQLTQESFKVFFARITLEDKLGTAYEPYIFAALNSAKVMVVLGTKPEYFNAVWVKNEWSRYLALVKNSGGKKMLIPAYKDMDPYDLPEEFSHLQAQDMSKLGFMQDLIRGIKKIISADAPKAAVKETVVVSGGNAAVEPLLKRTFMFLEDGNWQEADTYCEKVLDQDPENAQAYLGKLMAELQVKNRENLVNCKTPFDDRDNFSKVIRFGDENLNAEMNGYITHINDRRLTNTYDSAVKAMEAALNEDMFKSAAHTFESISGFKDADDLAGKCLEKAEICRKDSIYENAEKKQRNDYFNEAMKLYESISGWKDADVQAAACKKKIAQQKEMWKKKIKIIVPILAAVVIIIVLFVKLALPKIEYNSALNKAMGLIDSGDYDAGYAILEELGENETIQSNKYDRAMEALNDGNSGMAYDLLKDLSYKDSSDKTSEILAQHPNYKFRDAAENSTISFGQYEQDNNLDNGKESIRWIVVKKEEDKILLMSEKALDCKPYNDTYSSNIVWENCTLRIWLNSTFINTAFSSEEQIFILQTEIPKSGKSNSTNDKIFIFDSSEADRYGNLYCRPTEYAAYNGVWHGSGEFCEYFLRGTHDHKDQLNGYKYVSCPAVVDRGAIEGSNEFLCVTADYVGVRPSMWISLE